MVRVRVRMQAREQASSTHAEAARVLGWPNWPMGTAHAMRVMAARAHGPAGFGGPVTQPYSQDAKRVPFWAGLLAAATSTAAAYWQATTTRKR